MRLTGRRARHVHEVHRAQVGDSLTVGRVNGQVEKGTRFFVACSNAGSPRVSTSRSGNHEPLRSRHFF